MCCYFPATPVARPLGSCATPDQSAYGSQRLMLPSLVCHVTSAWCAFMSVAVRNQGPQKYQQCIWLQHAPSTRKSKPPLVLSPCPYCAVQATIQGALGTAPLLLIQANKRSAPNFAEYEEWGEDILNVCVFAIILLAPVGLLIIALLGPRWLDLVSVLRSKFRVEGSRVCHCPAGAQLNLTSSPFLACAGSTR